MHGEAKKGTIRISKAEIVYLPWKRQVYLLLSLRLA
jgi:hypothetical protein